MNQMRDLEMRLASWKPRHPSGKLRAVLFPGPSAADGRHAGPGFNWLVPAMAALMLVCSLAEQPTMTISVYRANNSGPLVATLLSNQSAAPYFTSGSDRGRNRLAGSFEWTNRSASYSILRSLSSSGGDLNQ